MVRLIPVTVQAPDFLNDSDPKNTDDFPTIITTSPREVQTPLLAPGSRLGNFELMEAIGSGGMATVFKARDVDLGRIVALKILPPATARDTETVARFKLEARAAAKLDHENIARVYFCGEDCGLHYIAFEFVEGENLRQVMDRRGRISPDLAVKYMMQLAAGLAHAAERGVVHRDVKPSNILITPDGRAKIVDMGLARHLEGQSVNGGVTQSGVTLGTFDYISPEQALDPRRADIRSDIYSLGCAFYHALTGRPPVPEGTAAKKLQAHQHDQPTDPRDLNPAIGDGLALILARMMAKNPDHRYQTPQQLIVDLLALGTTSNLGSSQASIASLHTQPSTTISLSWLVAIAILVVAATVYWNWSETHGSGTTAPWQEPIVKRTDPGNPTIPVRPTTSPQPSTNRITDARGIADAIARQGERATIQLRPGAVYDLTALAEGITFTGTELIIEPEAERSDRGEYQRPVLRVLARAPESGDATRPGTLTVRNTERLILRGIEIVIVERAPTDRSEDDPIGLLVHNVAKTELENCLLKTSPDSRRGRIVGAAVSRDPRSKPGNFSVRRSLIDLGSQAIGFRFVERTEAELIDVGFGPHQSAILWTDDANEAPKDTDPRPTLSVQSSTFVFDRGGSALTVGAHASGGATFSACVFAEAVASDERTIMPGTEPRPGLGSVIRWEDPLETNRFVVIEGATVNAVYRVNPPPGTSRFITLLTAPWNSPDPRPHLALAQPWDALQLNLNEKRLRVGGVPHVLGVTTIQSLDRSTRPLYDGAWPPQKPQLPVQAKSNQRVVHPDATPEDATSRLYPTIAKAFEDLKSGETLLIAQNGPVAVSVLPERSLRATIGAFEGFQPILEASDETVRRPDAALFPLAGGEITFFDLQFHLRGRPAVVTMAGGTVCNFKQCSILLDEKDDESISVILLTEPTREMKMLTNEVSVPRIRFDQTWIHGRGRVVALRAPRAFEWNVENSAFVLDGPVLFADEASRESTVPRANIRWKNTTSISMAHQWEIHGSATRCLGLDVTCERCLIASGQRRRSLPAMILLGSGEGPIDPSVLNWRSDGPNIYSNFDPFVEFRTDGIDRPMDWDAERWIRSTGDMGRVAAVRFATALTAAKLKRLKPDELKAEVESTDFGIWRPAEVGADLQKIGRISDEKPR